jgi:hypothetical protein
MKKLPLTCVLLTMTSFIFAQGANELKAALGVQGKKVQAIHYYPKEVKDGENHYVEVVSVEIAGNSITITEKWKNWLGQYATTTLRGQITNGQASGEWKSNYSSGTWTYDFSKQTGLWNKPKSMFDGFTEMQKLEFRIVGAGELKDGFH